jgi:hypothetical protein
MFNHDAADGGKTTRIPTKLQVVSERRNAV